MVTIKDTYRCLWLENGNQIIGSSVEWFHLIEFYINCHFFRYDMTSQISLNSFKGGILECDKK